jgi:hypothetical protein
MKSKIAMQTVIEMMNNGSLDFIRDEASNAFDNMLKEEIYRALKEDASANYTTEDTNLITNIIQASMKFDAEYCSEMQMIMNCFIEEHGASIIDTLLIFTETQFNNIDILARDEREVFTRRLIESKVLSKLFNWYIEANNEDIAEILVDKILDKISYEVSKALDEV